MADEPQDEAPVAPATTIEELEQRLNTVQQQLTQRINAINKTVSDALAEQNTKVGEATNAVKRLTTKVDNNEASIASFQGSLDTLTTAVTSAKSETEVLTKHVAELEKLQGALNTALVNGIQSAKDFALEQGQAAKQHADTLDKRRGDSTGRALGELSGAITRLENAPVKPHTHSVHVTVETENPSVEGQGAK